MVSFTDNFHRSNSLLGSPWFSVPQLPTWQANHVYATNSPILDSNANEQLALTTIGDRTSGNIQPVWNPSVFGTTPDHNVTWTNFGTLTFLQVLNNECLGTAASAGG